MKSPAKHRLKGAAAGRGDEAPFDLWSETPWRAGPDVDLSAVPLFLRRNGWRIGAVALLMTAALFGALWFFLSKYVATATLMLDPREARITQGAGVLSHIGADAITIESIVQVTKSESFLGALVDRLDLVNDKNFAGKGATDALKRQATIEKLSGKLNIARRGTTYVIDVTVSSADAARSAAVANAAAQKIIDDQRELRSGASEKTAQDIDSRLAELRARVNRAEEAAAELKSRLKVTEAGQNSTLLERRVFELNQQSVMAGARTAETRARYELLRKAGARAGDTLSPTVQSNVLSSLRAEFARLTRQAADQSTVLGERHPEVKSLNAQIMDVKRQMAAEIARMTATARSEYLEAAQREESVARQLKETQNDAGALGPQLVKVAELEREAKAERSVYEQLLNRQRELIETKNLEPSDIRLVSPASPPVKASPSRLMLAAAAAAAGLLVGLFYALAREWMRGTLMTPREAERLSGAQVAALAPHLEAPAGEEPGGGRVVPDLAPWLADFCAQLSFEASHGEGLVVLVASGRRGEGRSTIAANMAAWFAQSDLKTLLLEADRDPRPNARPRYGLLDALAMGEDLERALIEHPSEGYTLLPFGGGDAGRAPVGALMSGVTLRAALRLLRQWFDIVVIDGPPVLESSHARLLAAQADVTAFVVEWDKSSPAQTREALAQIDPGAAALIFNKVDVKRFRLFDPAGSRKLSAQAQEEALAA